MGVDEEEWGLADVEWDPDTTFVADNVPDTCLDAIWGLLFDQIAHAEMAKDSQVHCVQGDWLNQLVVLSEFRLESLLPILLGFDEDWFWDGSPTLFGADDDEVMFDVLDAEEGWNVFRCFLSL